MTINCRKCNAPLSEGLALEICPKCLMAAGMQSDSQTSRTQGSKVNRENVVVPEIEELAVRFPQLEVLELLGIGGMGAVFKVKQLKLDRVVALKIIRPEAAADAAFASRFNREARTLAKLNHPHIVSIYDFGELTEPDTAQGSTLYYFLMEYVEGANLRQLMHGSKLTPQQALAIVPQVCEALQYAHSEGVVHRDIKPENILVNKHGQVKIADFGIAKIATGKGNDNTLTGTHQVMGTPRYMAPEQMESSRSVDHRADIYSLGVVFYEMLTGEIPAGHFEPPSRKVQVDVRLDEVVLRSMAREPDRRYQHASDVKTEIERVANTASSNSANSAAQLATENYTPALSSEEQQRTAELAEIAPDWLLLPILGLFGLGWVLMSAFWSLRMPGLVISSLIMAAITYYVMQLRMRYLPKLKNELEREAIWQKIYRYTMALVVFIISMFSMTWFQTAVADALPITSLTDSSMSDKEKQLQQARLAGFQDLSVDNIFTTEFGFTFTSYTVLFSIVVGCTCLWAAIGGLIQTRRYRYSWKNFWSPSISTTFWCLSMLLMVHVVHLVMVRYSSISTNPVQFNTKGTSDDTQQAVSRWCADHNYYNVSYRKDDISVNNAKSGELFSRTVASASWFDRYQPSFRYYVLRPKPMMRIVTVSKEGSTETRVIVEMPSHTNDSPEEGWWDTQLQAMASQLEWTRVK